METFSVVKETAGDAGNAAGTPVAPVAADTPVAAGPGGLAGLAGRSDAELLGIVAAGPPSSAARSAACEVLVTRYRGLVRACVQRYRRSPESAEDLMQVGYVGLLKAIGNFDPALGQTLAGYAQPCISGELKRHFRDKRWQLHVERPVQELVLAVRAADRELAQQLGGEPADGQVAAHLGVTAEQVRRARAAALALQPASLDAPLDARPGSAGLADLLGGDDPRMEHALDMAALASHWGELPRREQKILLLRYYGDLTQAQIGQQLGISQMHVSRLLTRALTHLRHRILDLTPDTDTLPAAS